MRNTYLRWRAQCGPRSKIPRALTSSASGTPSKINPLEFFNYPNQALTGQHDIVEGSRRTACLPGAASLKPGLRDASYRGELLRLAGEFAMLGDRALAFEKARAR
jgi:hypothetical protein